jgi:hypothetical protein
MGKAPKERLAPVAARVAKKSRRAVEVDMVNILGMQIIRIGSTISAASVSIRRGQT